MERTKQNSSSGSVDKLANVKAAAWAWYQHGSGSEVKTMPEFGITRTHHGPGPSRYKLEATRIDIETQAAAASEEEEGGGGDSEPSSLIHTDNSLLDSFEIQRISKQLGDLIESSSKLRFGNVCFEQRKDEVMKKKKKKMTIKRFLLRRAAVCGTKEDVVDGSTKTIRAIREQER